MGAKRHNFSNSIVLFYIPCFSLLAVSKIRIDKNIRVKHNTENVKDTGEAPHIFTCSSVSTISGKTIFKVMSVLFLVSS